MFPLGHDLKYDTKQANAARVSIKRSMNGIYTYASIPAMDSCQTKMVLGYYCGDKKNITNADITEAIRRLHGDFYFIGLTEETEASANLFLAMHYNDAHINSPQHRYPSLEAMVRAGSPPYYLSHQRSNREHDSALHAVLVKNLTESGWRDIYDDMLYMEASRIFYSLCSKYRIKTVFGSLSDLLSHLHV